MADLLYLRHSTDKQTNARQRHALATYLAAGATAFEDPATSSRLHPLKRAGFLQLLDAAAVGDTVRLADAARLFRSVRDVLDVRTLLQRRGLHLRVAAGAWAGMDLAADDPMTKLFVTMLAGVLEFQRDMISENTREGVAAAASSGKTLGRPTALDPRTAQAVVSQYHEGAAIKALARQHGVAPRTIRRVLDADGSRTVPAPRTHETDSVPPETAPHGSTGPVTIEVPGLLATHLDAEGDEAIRGVLGEGWTIRRGQGHSVRVTAALALHQAALAQCADLVQDGSASAARKAYRVYAARISAAQ